VEYVLVILQFLRPQAFAALGEEISEWKRELKSRTERKKLFHDDQRRIRNFEVLSTLYHYVEEGHIRPHPPPETNHPIDEETVSAKTIIQDLMRVKTYSEYSIEYAFTYIYFNNPKIFDALETEIIALKKDGYERNLGEDYKNRIQRLLKIYNAFVERNGI
jgi:hypothetical protein